ncbi:hypothetical protein [Fimbriiglobus ruber]|uniref:Uncharacterized protein n=1 Tax=Fimbriiglobus ruber TaxID=1908690 RepID=A0A225DHN5_9BACT|nr:hypothetical protein [Fimbriiglobus ruber]OWK36709.1 hypothetical protein FRUB_09272 [Fimbriiglobus ruber]
MACQDLNEVEVVLIALIAYMTALTRTNSARSELHKLCCEDEMTDRDRDDCLQNVFAAQDAVDEAYSTLTRLVRASSNLSLNREDVRSLRLRLSD